MSFCRFTPTSSRDIEGIMDYLADVNSFEVAEAFLTKLNQKCAKLAQFPSLGRSRSELSLGLRSFSTNPYLIFYRQVNDGIEIMRVVSGYQDLRALFDEES
jgi:toxin ParE1/3/4